MSSRCWIFLGIKPHANLCYCFISILPVANVSVNNSQRMRLILVILCLVNMSSAYYNIYRRQKGASQYSGTWQPYVCALEVIDGNTFEKGNLLKPMLGFRQCTGEKDLITKLWAKSNPSHEERGSRRQLIQINLTPEERMNLGMLMYLREMKKITAEKEESVRKAEREKEEERKMNERKLQEEKLRIIASKPLGKLEEEIDFSIGFSMSENESFQKFNPQSETKDLLLEEEFENIKEFEKPEFINPTEKEIPAIIEKVVIQTTPSSLIDLYDEDSVLPIFNLKIPIIPDFD